MDTKWAMRDWDREQKQNKQKRDHTMGNVIFFFFFLMVKQIKEDDAYLVLTMELCPQ